MMSGTSQPGPNYDPTNTPSFGAPYSVTDWSQQGPPNIPGQIWDPARPSTPYGGSFYPVGGSFRQTGQGPFGEYCFGQPTNDNFWSHAFDRQGPSWHFGIGGGRGR